MNELLEGVKKFSNEEFSTYSNLFKKLTDKQHPHTLFITCSDSRIQPGLITQSRPGDLFIIRNVANVVPPYDSSINHEDTLSALEYGVQVLEVNNIVVCGHSNCGGCKALFAEKNTFESMPHTGKWLELARPAKDKAETRGDSSWKEDPHRSVEQENILLQMDHLLSHPFIREKQENGSLRVHGWYYDIGAGEIFNYNLDKQLFEKVS